MVNGDHVALHQLEELAAELLDAEPAARVKEHVDGCASCAARLQEVRAALEAERIQHLPAAFVERVLARQPARRMWVPRWTFALIPAAAAAVLALVFVASPPDRTDSILIKGSDRLVVRAKQPDDRTAKVIEDGARLPPRTVLELNVLPGTYQRAIVCAVDARGEISEIADLVLSGPQSLPVGLEVDDAPTADRIFAFFSSTAVSREEVKRELERSFEAAGNDLLRMTPSLEQGRFHAFTIQKIAR